jgi:peptide/nickel transport system substrate-binding protein
VVWKKKAIWWAARKKLLPSPKPKYVIDITNTCNACDVSGVITGIEDLNNNFLPGIQNYIGHEINNFWIHTYYPSKPYHLSANTSWLTPNTTHKPLDDKRFRKALATSINIPNIVANDYGHLVRPADATGLLPTWNKWVDQKQLKALGFTFSTEKARSLLAAAGYRDVNGDGYVENKDGSPIDLKLAVPMGWSDWEVARDMIVSSARKAGIRIHKDEGDYNHWQSQRNLGAFDLVLDNHFQLSDSPWTYYDGIFRLPVQMEQTAANFGRYRSLTAWKLTRQLDKTRPADIRKRKAIMKKLQKIMLTELPIIPLWYNGIWAQSQSEYWKNWPSSTSTRNYTPTMWRGYMQMTGIDMITHLKPAQDGGD